jgi:hypothetical protein
MTMPNTFLSASLTNLPDDYDLFVEDPQGNLVAFSAYGGTADELIANLPVGTATGPWYLRVVGFNHAFNPTEPYTLRATISQATPSPTPTPTRTATPSPTSTPTRVPLDPYEPNDSLDQARPISTGIPITAYVDRVDDVDSFRVMVPQGGSLVAIVLSNLPADYDLYLYNPWQSLVDWSRYGGRANEYILYIAPTSGVYYIQVVGYNRAYDPVNPYRLQVNVTAPRTATNEE